MNSKPRLHKYIMPYTPINFKSNQLLLFLKTINPIVLKLKIIPTMVLNNRANGYCNPINNNDAKKPYPKAVFNPLTRKKRMILLPNNFLACDLIVLITYIYCFLYYHGGSFSNLSMNSSNIFSQNTNKK